MWDRRQFLKAAGAGFLASLMPRPAAALSNAELVLVSACQLENGRFGALLVSERGEIIKRAPLPDRGHGVAACPVTGRFAIFARRPGTFAAVFDANGQPLATPVSVAGRHFYGHGVFAPDGKLLYATENDFDNGVGVIGVYDATDNFTRIGELDSGGVGPHDMILSADGRYLIVANGGMETHPDFGRTPLNLATMQPNLSFVDRDNGTVAAVHDLPADLHKLSLRHLAPGPEQSVWIGGQFMGEGNARVPLIARAGLDSDLSFAELPEEALAPLLNYVGALASSPDGTRLVATSPVGNTAMLFDSVSGQVELTSAQNVCGVSWGRTAPILSTGSGLWVDEDRTVRSSAVLFDNHLTVAG